MSDSMRPNQQSDDGPLDAAAMAALMQDERRAATRRDLRASAVIVGAWGIVWLVGYLALWSGEQFGGNPWFRLPGGAPGWIFGGLLLVGFIVSTAAGVSMGRGRRGPSNRAGAMFGVSFVIGSIGVSLFATGMARSGLTGDQQSLLYPAAFTLLIGALYMAGAGLTRSRPQYVAGVAMVIVVVVATWVGVPQHLLVYAAAGLILLTTAWMLWTGRIDA